MTPPKHPRAGQPGWAYEMELSLVHQIAEVKESIPSDDRIRILARDELGLAHRTVWNTRSAMTAVAMFAVAVSTFVLTAFRG